MGRRRFFLLLRISTPFYTMPLHRFSLSSGQDHTVLCVLQGSYGSCPWMNSLMWPFHSSTASAKALSKIMGEMLTEHSIEQSKEYNPMSEVYPFPSLRLHTRIIPPPWQPNIAFVCIYIMLYLWHRHGPLRSSHDSMPGSKNRWVRKLRRSLCLDDKWIRWGNSNGHDGMMNYLGGQKKMGEQHSQKCQVVWNWCTRNQ